MDVHHPRILRPRHLSLRFAESAKHVRPAEAARAERNGAVYCALIEQAEYAARFRPFELLRSFLVHRGKLVGLLLPNRLYAFDGFQRFKQRTIACSDDRT